MQIGKKFYAKNREEWRKWLSKNYDKEKEIWLVYYKKSTGKPTVSYNDAVEEALCFGWIDSIEKGVDHETFAGRFTPRKLKSNLSDSNVKRIQKLIREGKMTKPGLDILKGRI